jgi:hypothetical protein
MRNNHLEWVMIGFVVSRGISFVTNFLLGREYQRTSASDLFDQPYARVIVLHVALIFGGAVLMFLNSPKGGLILLVLLKTALDLLGHFVERTKFAERTNTVAD